MTEENTSNESNLAGNTALAALGLHYVAKGTGDWVARRGYAALGTRLLGLSKGLSAVALFGDIAIEGTPAVLEYQKFRSAVEKDMRAEMKPMRDGLEKLAGSGEFSPSMSQYTRFFVDQFDKKGALIPLLHTAEKIEKTLGNLAKKGDQGAEKALDILRDSVKSFVPNSTGRIDDIRQMLNAIPTDLDELRAMQASSPTPAAKPEAGPAPLTTADVGIRHKPPGP